MFDTMRWDGAALVLLDQTKLPTEVQYGSYTDYRDVCVAIQRLVVRGAPALGAAAGFAMVLGWRQLMRQAGGDGESKGSGDAEDESTANAEIVSASAAKVPAAQLLPAFAAVRDEIIAARPTAVNLSWGARLLYERAAVLAQDGADAGSVNKALEKAAQDIFAQDIAVNKRIGQWGATLMPNQAVVLTHCNAGALATCGYGTALGVIRAGHEAGKIKMVYSDETRPLLQGARLTAWELMQDYIPVTTITDGMAAWTMKQKGVNFVVVGADRIAANGDTANKIGTYGVALAAKAMGISFYIAAPSSTFDFTLESGEGIPIEERDAEEVRSYRGAQLAPPQVQVFNPAFDVTPAALIKGIITECGVLKPPFTESIAWLRERAERH